MAAIGSTDTFDAALKQHYTGERIENMVYKDNPLFALMPKYESFGGLNLKLPIKWGNPMGRSAGFLAAQTNETSGKISAFVLERKKDYAVARIENETVESSKGNANAFMEAATFAIDGAIQAITRSLAVTMYGDGTGSIGTVGAVDTTGTDHDLITLSNIQQITNFEVDMELNFASSDTNKTVLAVNRDTGVIKVDDSSGATATDAIYVDGDRDAVYSGLGAWIPSTAPASTDSFFGVNRFLDTDRLAGVRFAGGSLPLEEALIGAAARVAREGGKPDYCFMNYSNFADLEKALGSKVAYVEKNIKPEIGFRGILIHGPRGPINVIPDQNCPPDVAYLLQLDTWKLYSLGKAPKILASDGNKMLRVSNADQLELRVGFYGQLGCRAPGYNARIALS
jgi:hypothetical protein